MSAQEVTDPEAVPRWNRPGYLRLREVTYDTRGKKLTVRFGNGDTVCLRASQLLPADEKAQWERLEVEENYHIHVPVAAGKGDLGGDSTDIPGFTIRALTDAEFAAHLARKAAEEAHCVGQRLRTLRQARGLTAKEVAERAGLAQQTITRIELGQHDVVYSTLERILAAMGYTLANLTDPSVRTEADPADAIQPAE